MRPVSDGINWMKKVEPVILKVLQENIFFDIMKKSFPCVHISDVELSAAHDFVASIMKWNPAYRPSLKQMKCHNFLANSECRDVINDVKFDAFKTIVTNPFLKGWIDPVVENNKASIQVPLKSEKPRKSITSPLKFDVVTNPFLKGVIEPVIKKIKISIKVTLKAENGRESIANSYNHRSFKEFEIGDECDKTLYICKRPNENCASDLPHVNSGEETTTKNVMPPKKEKIGGKIKQWIKKNGISLYI